jgi:hypothetical protein
MIALCRVMIAILLGNSAKKEDQVQALVDSGELQFAGLVRVLGRDGLQAAVSTTQAWRAQPSLSGISVLWARRQPKARADRSVTLPREWPHAVCF